MKVLIHCTQVHTKSGREDEGGERFVVGLVKYWNEYMASVNHNADLNVTVFAEDMLVTQKLASHLCALEAARGTQWMLHPDSGSRSVEEDDLLPFDHYLCATISNTTLLRFNEFCRANGVCFISVLCMGCIGSVFYDQGPNAVESFDIDPATIVEIVGIDAGRIRLSPDVSFAMAKGDWVKFSALNNAFEKNAVFGSAELLNDKVFLIEEVFPETNEIVLDFSRTVTNYERALTNYEAGTGVLEKALRSGSILPWTSWKDAVVRPNADITKASNHAVVDHAGFDSLQLHFAILGLQHFFQVNNRLPAIENVADTDEVIDLAKRILELNCEVNRTAPATAVVVVELDEDLCARVVKHCGMQLKAGERCVYAATVAAAMNPSAVFSPHEQVFTFSILGTNGEVDPCAAESIEAMFQHAPASTSPEESPQY